MKRIRKIACIAGLLVIMMTSAAFAEGNLEITGSYPEDGQHNTTMENMAIKLQFNKDVDSKDNQKANNKCFKIVDDEGKELPVRVYYNPEDATEVLVLADTTEMNSEGITVKDNADYTLQISEEFTANDGSTLGSGDEITFRTLNQSRNTMVYMVMMFAMFGGMFFFTNRQMKKHMAEENAGKTKEEPFNPYKEAKKTGKSVDEVIAEHEKEMAKKAAKEARHAKHHAEEEVEETVEETNGNYKVKGPRPISAGGSSYITGRKAIAEAKKAEEERLARRRAAAKKKKKK
jgi:methionine-rich copper-binding protein CopC